MPDFHDDITDLPRTSGHERETPGRPVDREAMRRRLRESDGETHGMEFVNEEDAPEPEPEVPEPAPEPEPKDYGPEEVPNEADDPNFTGPLPTDNTRAFPPSDDDPGIDDADGPGIGVPWTLGQGALYEVMQPDEFMSPIDQDGVPIDPIDTGDDDFGFGGLH